MNPVRGIITTYVLVFGAIFLLLLSGLLGFILLQLRHSAQRVAWNQSLQIAEAGINYYHWCLNNRAEAHCLTEKEYRDPAGKPIGKFSLSITSQTLCGEIIQKAITSRGWTYDWPEIDREIRVLYGRESVAKYAYLINDNVWAGADRKIRGLYHSNKGIRMDGTNYSLVTSAQEKWVLTRSFGYPPCPRACWREGGNCVCPGVFTTTDNPDTGLFDWPVPRFDFDKITVDLKEIRDLTKPYPRQYYWPPANNIHPQGKGYHLIFKPNGTFEVWIITELDSIRAYSTEKGWHDEHSIIEEKYLFGTYPINPACPLIFIEDNLWVEGIIKGKVTIAAAKDPGETTVWLPGNIDYTVLDGSDGLAVISEENVLITPDSPNIMTLRGVFVAQKGYFGRNHYTGDAPTRRGESLIIYGSIVSNGRVGTAWFNPAGQVVSGYLKRETYIDPNLIYNPPSFVPFVRPEFKIINWEETE